MKKSIKTLSAIAVVVFMASCSNAGRKTEKTEAAVTKVTAENYALAETQVIMTAKVKQIAKVTGTKGTGVIMHNKAGASPKDRVIMRLNFDTKYSWLVLDLTEPATITMPDVGGRYQTAWIISEEHYNPFALDKPGEYELTEENVGSKYAIVVFRTQANIEDPEDMKASDVAMDAIKVEQKDKGAYVASNKWDMDDILAWRAKYQKIQKEKGIIPENMFGKKGERTLEEHNVGTAFGWGGFTKEQAVYPIYYPENSGSYTFTIKDAPIKAFWSITVYNKDGYAQTDTYNINSQFAKKNTDGSVTIYFGGDPKADNYMETFEGWNFALRLYQPTEAYFDGTWTKPQLELVN